MTKTSDERFVKDAWNAGVYEEKPVTTEPTQTLLTQKDREAAVSIGAELSWSSTICFDVLNGTCEYVNARYPDEYIEQIKVLEAFAKHRLAHQPQPVDAILYNEAAINAVQTLLEKGKATVDSDGYLKLVQLIERSIDHARKYGTREGDPRRKYTPAQMEIAIRAAISAMSAKSGKEV